MIRYVLAALVGLALVACSSVTERVDQTYSKVSDVRGLIYDAKYMKTRTKRIVGK